MKNNNINTMKRGSRSVVSTTLATAYIEHSFSIHSAYIGSRWQTGGKLLRLAAMICLLLTLGVGQMWGADPSWTYTFTGAPTISSHQFTVNSATWTESTTVGKGSPSIASGNDNSVTCVKFGSGKNNYYSSITLSTSYFADYNIKSVYIVGCVNANSVSITATQGTGVGAVTIGTATISQAYAASWPSNANCQKTMNTNQGSGGTLTITISPSACAFSIKTITVTYTTASCGSATPSATGAASLNGSFNMTSTTSAIGVSTSSWNPGSSCSWSDYGFVWSDGTTTTTPTVSNNKVQVGTSGSATSWTGSVTPSGSTTPTSWTTGHTYYVRAYGKNNNGSATYAYGSAWSFTPRSVTFKANGGTGSDKVQYVQGGVSTALTSNSFTKTGYNFNGWNTDADGTSGTGYTNGQSVSLSGNLTLYAKWTAKTTTISFNQNSGTGGQTGTLTATYDAAMPSAPVTCPTRTGYDFGGYYDGSGGTGTQYYTSTGASARNWNKENSTWTLYAKWTIKNYSVTWKVNNTTYTDGSPSDNVNHGSRVAKLPTDPDPGDYCGDKFIGWTDATDGAYVHGTSTLFTTAGTAPVASGAQIFYAVFADYDE